MERRDFMKTAVAGGMVLGAASGARAQSGIPMPATYASTDTEVFIERDQPGKPHAGKVLAAIQPHNDDMPVHYAGRDPRAARQYDPVSAQECGRGR